jgi:hypothetical protein
MRSNSHSLVESYSHDAPFQSHDERTLANTVAVAKAVTTVLRLQNKCREKLGYLTGQPGRSYLSEASKYAEHVLANKRQKQFPVKFAVAVVFVARIERRPWVVLWGALPASQIAMAITPRPSLSPSFAALVGGVADASGCHTWSWHSRVASMSRSSK